MLGNSSLKRTNIGELNNALYFYGSARRSHRVGSNSGSFLQPHVVNSKGEMSGQRHFREDQSLQIAGICAER